MRIILYLFIAVIALLGVSFAALNAAPTKIDYYFGEAVLPLALIIAITLTLGIVLGVVVGLLKTLKLRQANYRLNNQIKLIKQEVESLRTLPFKDN